MLGKAGHSHADVEAELERIGKKARVRRRDNYVRETVNNAARFVGLNPPRQSPPLRAERPPAPPRERGGAVSGTAQSVAEAEARGIVFTLGEGFALHFDAPAGAMTSELRAALVAHKADVGAARLSREV